MSIGVKAIPLYSKEQLEKMAKEPEPIFSSNFILLLLGGRWPRYKKYYFEDAYGWKIDGNQLIACDRTGNHMRIPSLMLVIVDDLHGIRVIKRKILCSHRPANPNRGVKAFGDQAKKEWGKNPKKFMFNEEIVLALVGGEWPEYEGYGFRHADGWKVDGNQLVPCDFAREPIPVPNFMLAIVNNLDFTPPKIIVPEIVYPNC